MDLLIAAVKKMHQTTLDTRKVTRRRSSRTWTMLLFSVVFVLCTFLDTNLQLTFLVVVHCVVVGTDRVPVERGRSWPAAVRSRIGAVRGGR